MRKPKPTDKRFSDSPATVVAYMGFDTLEDVKKSDEQDHSKSKRRERKPR